MSMRTLEAAILAGAKVVFCNPKLRQKDIREWSTGEIKPREGEVVARIDDPGVFVAVLVESDRRASGTEERK